MERDRRVSETFPPDEYPPRYYRSLRDTLDDMGLLFKDPEMQEFDIVLGEYDELVLRLHGGSGSFELNLQGGGGISMPVHMYHPKGHCEGSGICDWCGVTLWD